MNIHIITTHSSNKSPGSFFRPYEIASNLITLGINAKIFTTYFEDSINYTKAHLEPLSKKKFLTSSNFLSKYYKLRCNRIFSDSPFDKFLIWNSKYIASRFENSIKIKPEIIQGEQEVGALAAIKVGKKKKIPIVSDIHNILPEELMVNGYIKPDGVVYNNMMKIENNIVNNSDGIIAVNEYMKEYLISKFNLDPQKIIILPPGGEKLFDEKNTELKFQNKQKKVIFAGQVNQNAHVDLFLKSIPIVLKTHKNIKFLIAEKGTYLKKAKQLSKQLSINPEFYWFNSRTQARELLKTCHIGILPSSNDIPRKLGTPLKLLEYVSFGIPVVANDIGSWSKIIEEEKIGILTNDDPQEFSDAVCKLLDDKKLYQQMQKNISKLLKDKFRWKFNVEKKLIPFYESVINFQ